MCVLDSDTRLTSTSRRPCLWGDYFMELLHLKHQRDHAYLLQQRSDTVSAADHFVPDAIIDLLAGLPLICSHQGTDFGQN